MLSLDDLKVGYMALAEMPIKGKQARVMAGTLARYEATIAAMEQARGQEPDPEPAEAK